MIARIGHDGEIEGFYIERDGTMREPTHYVSKLVSVTAIQWTGENIRAIQDFVAPSSPYYQPARAAKAGSAAEIMDHHMRAQLSVMVVDHAANNQWPAIAPHYKMQSVEMNGWLVRRDDNPGEVVVLTAAEFAATYAVDDRPPVAIELPDGIVRVPASQASQASAVAAFPLGQPLLATHPRAQSTSDVRVAPPPPRIVSREPDAADDGSTIDRPEEAPAAGDDK